MKIALMVAEKPSLAASLANILSNNQAVSRRGSNGVCTVHEWKGMFFGQTVLFRMTSVCGHVLTIDFDARFNNWDKVDPLELFSCPTERKEATPKLRMQSFLSQEARGCDYLILWLDCDKEGENICFEVIDAVKNSIKRIHASDVVWRAKFSSITEKDVKAAMYNLGKPNKNEALSVDARQELDLRIGCAFTRFQTKFFHRKYGNLDSSLISFGPCQTPTLGFCVERHDQIQTFKPEPYWVLQVTVTTSDKREIALSYQTSRIFERETAKALLQKFKSTPSLKVTSIVSKEKSKSRPIALNTVELMRAASAGLGIGPHHAMSVAERLYTQGYISYPRTETTRYPENFDLFEAVNIFVHNREYGQYACQILTDGVNRPKKGADVGDHPPITPMKSATNVELDGDSWKIYDYIVRHFLGSLSRDCKYLSTTTTFMAENDTFTFVGEMLLDPGYTAIMTWQGIAKNKVSPNVSVGDVVPIHNVQLTDHKTTPPDYLTESELITLMEKHGIGTDASIPVHINNISQRNYVTVANGRRLVPTNLGIILVHGYQKIDRELVEPTTRSKMEEQLNLIARGEADFLKVLGEVIKLFKKKYQFFTKNIEDMDSLFEVSFTPLADSGKALSRCGKCRRYMKYIQARPNRLHCSHCNETYNLPQNGNIRIFKELRCPVDDFELLTWSSGSRGKSFPLCPSCYNDPPYPDMKKNSGCNMCIHPTCPQAIYSIGIASCINCDDGILVLDPSSGPKWKVLCNRCDIIMPVFDDAQKVVVDKKACKCGAQLIKVEYKEEKTKLPGDRVEMTECMFCHPGLSNLVKQQHAVSSKPAFHHHGGRGPKNRRNVKKNKAKQPKDKMSQLAAYFV
ncbi:hypothetical protein V9T40_013041 [Parthenolecanium corni]|uniref:DNA topoisomerase n=1 Tax=Parthenolecanium corni TaxID=536013 RepID=A0AAN9T8T5_9HEMI